MTEEYFSQFEELQARDLQQLMELSKVAFSEGKKTTFINSDLKDVLLNIDGKTYCYSDFLVRASMSGKDMQELELARQQAQALAQNADGQFSRVLKLIRGNNISKILEEMEKMEEEVQARMEQAQEQQRLHEQALEEKKLAISENNLRGVMYVADKKAESAQEVATINAEAKLAMDYYNETGGSNEIAALEGNIIKREESREKANIERERLSVEREKSIRDADAKKYQADTNLKIAKENKGQ